MKDRSELKIVSDQVGSPTYAADLAAALLQVIGELAKGNRHYGVYHYSNEGAISWFDFATAIQQIADLHCQLLPIPTTAYPTPAKRPAYSAMDTQKIVRDFGVSLRSWKDSLAECISKL